MHGRKDTKVYDLAKALVVAETAAQRSADMKFNAKLDAISCANLVAKE